MNCVQNFKDFDIALKIKQTLKRIGFIEPTEVQEKAIPKIIAGSDLLCSAQTGTGKTAVYLIPLANFILQDSFCKVLVILPTRELAQQVYKVARDIIGAIAPICLLIGGINIKHQIRKLLNNPRLIIGTPGRVNDHIDKKRLLLYKFNKIVVDEVDKMLDMGFIKSLDKIFESFNKKRQTLMFSATISKKIEKLCLRYLKDPSIIAIKKKVVVSSNIEENTINVIQSKKILFLLNILKIRDGSVIVFVNTKKLTFNLKKILYQNKYKVLLINSDIQQKQRTKFINDFKNNKFRILVATDIVSRGLDIPKIQHVINFDIPVNPEDYIHRIGRTARINQKGKAVNFITLQDRKKWIMIQRLINNTKQ